MLVLLPPSEGKTAPPTGPPVDLARLSHPALAPHRERVGRALAAVSGRRDALTVLGVGDSLAAEVEANTGLWELPSGPAHGVYTGVLYDAAGAAGWSGATLQRAAARVRIVSALWGLVSPADAIPAYRLSMGTTLPRLGGLKQFWKPRVGAELDDLAGDSLVVDCRSSDYAAVWRPSDASRWVSVRVERDLAGKRTVVSHMAKHTRGLLTGALVGAPDAPSTPDELADAASRLIGADLPGLPVVEVELAPPRGAGPRDLTIIVQG